MSDAHRQRSFCYVLCLALPLGACGNETVDLGGGRINRGLQRGARCLESPVLRESVRISSQAELAELSGCEEIAGDLRIEVFAGAALSPLAALRVVDGMLELGAYPQLPEEEIENAEPFDLRAHVDEIVASGYLPSLAGLERLERVASLNFYYVAAEDLSPLLSLRELGGQQGALPVGFVALQASRVRTLHGLENVSNIAELILSNNPELESLGGVTVGPAPRSIYLLDSPKLSSLAELAGVDRTTTLSLGNLGITDLDSLSNLSLVESSISLTGNRHLLNVDRLAQVMTESLEISDNAVLASIPRLQRSGYFEVFVALGNPELRTIQIDLLQQGSYTSAPRSLAEEVEIIEIGGNARLTQVSISAGLEQARFLAIYQNPALESVRLGTLTSVESLEISDNARLSRLDLGALTRAESLSVLNNPQLDPTQLATLRTFEARIQGNAAQPASP